MGPFPRWENDLYYSPLGGIGKVSSRFATYVHSTFEFDAEVFGLSVNEASLMDPQQRVLLEETVAAFHAAGEGGTPLSPVLCVAGCGGSCHIMPVCRHAGHWSSTARCPSQAWQMD